MDKRVEIGLQASVEGFANEHIAAGLLMKRYKNVSLVDLPLSPYDIIIVFKKGDQEDIIRAQVKTAKKGVKFTGGTRGGADRYYRSNVKTYRQSTKTADVVIGVEPQENGSKYNLYFVPTCMVEMLNQDSISLKKIIKLKNNYAVLESCKNREYIKKIYREIFS
jgi:hypothetical protein